MNKKTKNWLVVLAVILLVALLSGCFYLWRVWWPEKQIKISLGLAVSEFPWRNYSQAELNELYPQIKNASIPTRITPEETYTKFREALRTNNLELAVGQLSKESKKYNDNVNNLRQAYKDKKLQEYYREYPEKISKALIGQSLSQYEYDRLENGKTFVNSIDFIKDANGDWKMDSL
ncbi:MAG: hypothetical protein NTY61_01780 [Candidatus Parcubacteria bacterium]|nr:hypothetical protein [Candidatus Parcubacteria bacterium]